jgi:flagellar motor component MotA
VLLEDEIDTRANSNRTAARFFNTMGGYAPTIEIIGVVLSLTQVLKNSPALANSRAAERIEQDRRSDQGARGIESRL